jgi:ectoine hydroxylase-related dioxygenase (phytanoyl-CoA dioxygenase family)
MIALDITPAELRSGQMSREHLDAAVQAMKTDGFVVLNDVIDRAHLDMIRERMLDDLKKILQRDDAPFNFNAGNVQQQPPPFPPYLFRDVLVNDMVIAVSKAMLGPGVKNNDYTGNTALPGGQKQPVHPDIGQLWPNLETPTPPFALVVNVPVVDVSPQNGSTELWPGTHLDTTISIQRRNIKVPEDIVEKRRAIVPPLQPSMRYGSVLIRDMRMWHRGMPNHTDEPRPMIAMIHWVTWWNAATHLQFPKEAEVLLQHPDLKTEALFVDETIDHIRHGEAYDYQK